MDISIFFVSEAGKREEASEAVVGGGGFFIESRGRGPVSEEEAWRGAEHKCRDDVCKVDTGGRVNVMFGAEIRSPPQES